MGFYREEYEFGKDNENKLYIKLQNYFNDNLKQTTKTYCNVDYTGDRYDYELKTRRNKYNTYPTTIITSKKIENNTKKLKIIFNFTDGLYYIKYNKELFDKFEQKKIRRNDRTQFVNHYLIPIELLKKID